MTVLSGAALRFHQYTHSPSLAHTHTHTYGHIQHVGVDDGLEIRNCDPSMCPSSGTLFALKHASRRVHRQLSGHTKAVVVHVRAVWSVAFGESRCHSWFVL